jgi:hypothetical protein
MTFSLHCLNKKLQNTTINSTLPFNSYDGVGGGGIDCIKRSDSLMILEESSSVRLAIGQLQH